jgi:D-serine dehydratase
MLTAGEILRECYGANEPTVLLRPGAVSTPSQSVVCLDDVALAQDRYERFSPVLRQLFPDRGWDGRIASPLIGYLGAAPTAGRLMVKCDHALPMTGSVKARGGIYEVLSLVERLAVDAGLVQQGGPLDALLSPAAQAALSKRRVVVASTGNLGFSIGLVARAFGLQAEVHMSRDAKQWKKDRLARIGAVVIEHPGDFGSAILAARASATEDSSSHFVDDERSHELMIGYSAGAFELAQQLEKKGIVVDRARPLVVYLPCGVGGAPGGITFGLKHIFGENVRCVFVEPIASACMYLALSDPTGGVPPSVYDAGLDNRTVADGLAVGRASELVLETVGMCIDAVVAVPDTSLLSWVREAWKAQGLRLEPAAAAGFAALQPFASAVLSDPSDKAAAYNLESATHVVWTTGGSLLPEGEFLALLGAIDSLC